MEHILAQGLSCDHDAQACPIELRESSDDSCLRIQMKNVEEGIFPAGLQFNHENAAHEGTCTFKTDSNDIGPERSANDPNTAVVLDLREILPLQSRGDHARGVIGACRERELCLPASTIAIFQAASQ